MPRFDRVRWVPKRFRNMLPLNVMKQYHCIVVGGTKGVLTVAFTGRKNAYVIQGLRKMTGQDIFPVLIKPERMRILLVKAEASSGRKHPFQLRCYSHRSHIHALLMFYVVQSTKRPS
jgi:type II secretion system (T2SS) protein E